MEAGRPDVARAMARAVGTPLLLNAAIVALN